MDEHLLPVRKRLHNCSLIQPAVKKSSTSEAPEVRPRKRVSFSDQTSIIPPICHHDETKGSISKLDLVDVCGSGDVLPSLDSRNNSKDNREKGVLFQTEFNHYNPNIEEGNKQTNVPTYLLHKNAPAIERAWSGVMEVDGMMRLSVRMTAHLSAKISRKAYEFSKQINPKLHSKLLPRTDCYPKIFQESCPNKDDIALYFYQRKEDRPNGKYSELLRGMAKKDLMMCSCIDGIELLMFSSTILTADSQISGKDHNYFIWGVFRRQKARPVLEEGERLEHTPTVTADLNS